MNTLKVVHQNDELMKRADKEFNVVTHISEDEEKRSYSGEFLILDVRDEDEIQQKLKELNDMIRNKRQRND